MLFSLVLKHFASLLNSSKTTIFLSKSNLNIPLSEKNNVYSDFLFKKLQRKGYLYRDCQRMVNQDRNVFGSCMVAMGDADSLVSGLTRSFNDTLNHITRVISSKDNKNIIAITLSFIINVYFYF